MLFSCPVLQLKSGDAQGVVEGIASSFGGVDSFGDTVLPGAFSKTIAEHTAAKSMPSMLWNHGASRVVGRWQAMQETGRGLEVRGQLNMKTNSGRDAYEHLASGDVGGLSIGYVLHHSGSEMRDGVRHIKSVSRLHEVSLVAMPSDEGARITAVKSLDLAKPETPRDFVAALQALGFSRREAAQISTKGYAGFTPDEPDDDEPIVADNSAELASALSAIRSLTAIFKG